VLNVAILSFQRQPTPPFSFFLFRLVPQLRCAASRCLHFIGPVVFGSDGLEELATDLGASLFSVAHALFEIRAGGHTFGNAGILLQIVRGV